MKSVALTAFGDAANFADVDRPAPTPRPTDVVIRNRAVGFNPIDYQVRASGFEDLAAPIVLGFEVSGVVEQIGADVRRFAIGDPVMAWLGGPSLAGGYAEFSVAPEDLVAKVPPRISLMEAAAIPLAALTAF